MGVDTHGIIDRNITLDEVFNIVVHKYDKNATMHKETRDTSYSSEFGSINFKYNDEDRMFSGGVFLNNPDNYEFVKNDKHLWLSLGAWGSSVEIMKEVVAQFGGYIDENDCDSEGYYFLEQNPDGTIPPVIRATMKEINEKFGGVVVIVK